MQTVRVLNAILLAALPYAGAAQAAVYQLTPIGASGTASSVSNNGWVAGTNGANKAFIWSLDGGVLRIGDLPGGADYSYAKGVNSLGQVVGGSDTAAGNRAFIWDAVNGMRPLDELPGCDFSYATGINEAGQVVGTSHSASGYSAFVWTPGEGAQDIGDLPGMDTDVFGVAINDLGQIVGHTSLDGVINAFLWDPATGMTGLGDLPTGANVSYAYAINNATQVAGRGNTSNGDRAFLWSADTGMQNLGTVPDGYGSYAYGMNNNGQVVGHFTLGGQHRAFLWSAATGIQDLNTLAGAEAQGWLLLEAYDINDDGWIVGWGANPNGGFQGFLLRPAAPLPGDLAPAGSPDGRIDAADLMRLMRFIAAIESPAGQDAQSADINGDAVIDLRDAQALAELLGY